MTTNTELFPVLLESGLLILTVLLVLAALYGLILLASPNTGLRLNQLLSRQVSTRRISLPLDKQFHVERYFYRHAKIYGLLLLMGSGYLLYRLFFDFPLEDYARALPDLLPAGAWGWLLDALRIFLIIMTLFTLYIGLVVVIRPSNIKSMETHTNQWISTREKLAFMSRNVPAVDSAAERAPRLFGGVVFILAIAIIFVLY